MESATTLHQTLLDLNYTNEIGGNSTLPSLFPAWTITTITVCSWGILANFLVIFIIVFSSLRTSVFMNLIVSLAICDSMYLMSVINIQRGIFGQLFIKSSLLHCRINIFFIHVSGIVSSWITVFISLERYIAIYHPFKIHIYCTKRRTYLIILALTSITCICCVPFFYGCSLQLVDKLQRCNYFWEKTEYNVILISTVFIFQSLKPFLLITILNILMMRKIKVQKSFRAQGHKSKEPSYTYNSPLIVMMFCVCLIFAVTSFPATILVTVCFSCKFIFVELCTLHETGWPAHIGYILQDINHGINFFLYCLTGSIFRFAFCNLFKSRKKKSPGKKFEPHMFVTENIN